MKTAKVYITVLYFIGILAICFVLVALFRHNVSPVGEKVENWQTDEMMSDYENHSWKKYDKDGHLIFCETKKNGLREGYFIADYPDGDGRWAGNYDADIPVGRWDEWYADGSIRRISLFSDKVVFSNEYGYVSVNSRLISQTNYNIRGEVVGIVSNGTGVIVYMDGTGQKLSHFRTIGFTTNVLVSYKYGNEQPGTAVRQITVFSEDNNGASRTFFDAMFAVDGKIDTIREGRCSAKRINGVLTIGKDSLPPPFLQGKTIYPLPSIVNSLPVFDHRFFCTNATLGVTRLGD